MVVDLASLAAWNKWPKLAIRRSLQDAGGYTLRSRSDPRGRLRGGVLEEFGEVVAGGLVPP
jgi:hypothetical protein